MGVIDNALGIYPKALSFRSQRSAVLAGNIANSDTPGYKAKDYNFRDALKSSSDSFSVGLRTTNSGHQGSSISEDFGPLLYRVPSKETINGNTVESDVEQAAFSENAVRYQTTLQFLSGTISGLRLAIKGQR